MNAFQKALAKECHKLARHMGKILTTYYWETENSSGSFQAENDELAKYKAPCKRLILYKESNSKDGFPLIEIL